MAAGGPDHKRQGVTLPTWHNVPDFSEARSLFANYCYRRQVVKSSDDDDDFFAEADKRLDQLDAIIRRIVILKREHDHINRRIKKEGSSLRALAGVRRYTLTTKSLDIEIELLTEAFYSFAWRFAHVIKRVAFKKFNPKGVRDVQNRLVQRANKANRSHALNPNFSYGSDLATGPIIKQFGKRGMEIHDRGLFVNAQELIDEFVHRLRTAERVSAGPKKRKRVK